MKKEEKDYNEIIYLLSYPRSGNTFTRYILEQVTHYDSRGYRTEMDKKSVSNITAVSNGIIIKRHGHVANDKKDVLAPHRNKKLLFLVRNPIECFIRHDKYRAFGTIKNNLQDDAVRYFFENLDTYQNFIGDKKIVYYEDMILDLEGYIETIINFVDNPKIQVKEFMDNQEQHKQNGIKFYNQSAISMTRGESIIHHSAEISANERTLFWKNFMNRVSDDNKYIFERYF